MSPVKRGFMFAAVALVTVSLILLCLALWLPNGEGLLSAIRSIVALRIFVTVCIGFGLLACILVLASLIRSILRSTAQLSYSDDGSISIERGALVSFAAKSLEHVPGIEVQSVKVDVIPKRDSAVLDAAVVAVPTGGTSLMAIASAIQERVKTSLEDFTEHEVRYVAVNFVEARRFNSDDETDEAADDSGLEDAPESTGSKRQRRNRDKSKAKAGEKSGGRGDGISDPGDSIGVQAGQSTRVENTEPEITRDRGVFDARGTVGSETRGPSRQKRPDLSDKMWNGSSASSVVDDPATSAAPGEVQETSMWSRFKTRIKQSVGGERQQGERIVDVTPAKVETAPLDDEYVEASYSTYESDAGMPPEEDAYTVVETMTDAEVEVEEEVEVEPEVNFTNDHEAEASADSVAEMLENDVAEAGSYDDGSWQEWDYSAEEETQDAGVSSWDSDDLPGPMGDEDKFEERDERQQS